jgi:DNA polymerase-3 subunit epsilon
MAPNSLDALCRRYAIDNSRRDKHGALLDAELLAEVYLELIGGRQASFALAHIPNVRPLLGPQEGARILRPRPLLPRLTQPEIAAHANMVETLGREALWLNWLKPAAGMPATASG